MRAASMLLFLLAPTAMAQSGYVATGFEDGQPPGAADQILLASGVGATPRPDRTRVRNEQRHGGDYSMRIAGRSLRAYAYSYHRLLDDDIPIAAGTKLKYWIWHAGTVKVCVDGIFKDGSTLRDGGFVDQDGIRLHPGQRQGPLGQWRYVEVDLSRAAGKTLDTLLVGFDNGSDGFMGQYTAYIDDLQIGDPAAPPPPPPAAAATMVHLSSWTGQYVAAEGGGGGAVNANRAGAGVWETFGLVDQNGGTLAHGDPVTLRAHDGAHYLRASGGAIDARATAAGAGETFTLERVAGAGPVRENDQIGLRAADGRYVVAELGGGGPVNANRSGVGPWETFRITAAAGSRLMSHPSPLVGRLRLDGRGFVDDTGPVLPIMCHFGEGFSRYTRNRDQVRRQLDVIAQAGYHGVRVWLALTNRFWAGREVSEALTPDYWGQLRDFIRDCEARQLRAVLSQGDIHPVDIPDRRHHAEMLSNVLDQTGTANTVAIIEGGNESWQNGESDPMALARFVSMIEARHPQVLYTLSSAPGEDPVDLDRWSIDPADLFDVHGSRSGHWWDKTRHIFSVAYEGNLRRRFGWQGEPNGPGAAVSVTENKQELDDGTLALLAAMSLMSRQAYCYMSGPGVLFDSPIDQQPGFWTVPRVRDALPRDVMSFQRLIHGGQRWAADRVFEVVGDTRCDHALHDDGRFVTIIYGPQLTYNQVRPATIDKVTDIGRYAKIIVGRR
jgi:hypothetical protein